MTTTTNSSGNSSARERLINKNKNTMAAKKLEIVSYKQGNKAPKRKRQPKLNNMKQSYYTKPSYANVNLDENLTSERDESNFDNKRDYEYTSLKNKITRGSWTPSSNKFKVNQHDSNPRKSIWMLSEKNPFSK